jgi:perosamine synthetase
MPSESSERIPLSEPDLGPREMAYVTACLASGWVSSRAPSVGDFEREMAAHLGAEQAVACASGTAALHLSLLAAGVSPGDEVLLPALTFIAPANAVRYCGAWPVFIDCEPLHYQMDVNLLRRFLEENCARQPGGLVDRHSGRRVRAILPVHLLGHPVQMDPLMELARQYELKVVSDATQSLGARYGDLPLPRLGDLAVLSFNGNKMMTTGGGGMIISADPALASLARHLSEQAIADKAEYAHDRIGYNYRLSALAAALGRAQLSRLDALVASRQEVARRYALGLAGLAETGALILPADAPGCVSACWLYTPRVVPQRFGLTCRQLRQELASQGIEARTLYQPLHLSRALADDPLRAPRSFPVAELLHDQALSLPSSSTLRPAQQERVIAAIQQAAARAKG